MKLQQNTLCVCIGDAAQIEAAFADWVARDIFSEHELLRPCNVAQLITKKTETLFQLDEDATKLLHDMIRMRARYNELTLVHIEACDEQQLYKLAKQLHVPFVALTFHHAPLRAQYDAIYTYDRTMHIERLPSPFMLQIGYGLDVIGDIHGCFDEMVMLIEQLGYVEKDGLYTHPQQRRLVSVGDVCSRGPKSIEALQFWLRHVEAGVAYMTDSNHGNKIGRWLSGNAVTLTHGDELVEQQFIAYEQLYGTAQTAALKEQLAHFLLQAPSHYVVTDEQRIVTVITHAGIRDHYILKDSTRIRKFCRYGDVDRTDATGKPLRKDWYTEHALALPIIWGHVPHMEPTIIQHTINIDQGVVFGGQLTAIRLPEETFQTIEALHNYAGHVNNPITEQHQRHAEPLDTSRLKDGFTIALAEKELAISKEFARTALQQPLLSMPLPMLIPPPKASQHAHYLQHIDDAIAYYDKQRVSKLVAQQHANGHRALIFVAQTTEVAQRFIGRDTFGRITSLDGDVFFTDETLEHAVLTRMRNALQPYFTKHQTNYVLFEAVISPMNIRSADLLQQLMTNVEQELAARTAELQLASPTYKPLYTERLRNAARLEATLHNYSWHVSEKTIQIAPLQLLAHRARTFTDASFTVHAAFMDELVTIDAMFIASPYKIIEATEQQKEAVTWWEELSELGHIGAIVKPFDAHDARPHFIVYGREYLRLVHGIDYTSELPLRKKAYDVPLLKDATYQQLLLNEWLQRFVRYDHANVLHTYALAARALYEKEQRR